LPGARSLASTYTTVVRGVPELILLLLIYYGFPQLIQDIAESFGQDIRVDLNPFLAGTITIGFVSGDYLCSGLYLQKD
jgi:polar amino acid transport system permease protein/octopine/nopaline transport system permease protein/arginine/ornithine transport system permease protein